MKRMALTATAVSAALVLARPPRHVAYDALAADLDGLLGGERRTFTWRLGNISYRVAGSGPPVVLLHGIHAAASSWEMRHNLDPLAANFRVFAPDLLGFGLSDRPRLSYSAALYEEMLAAFLHDVVGGAAHLVASSLSSAYAVSVAAAHPDLVASLVLICPTGIETLSGPPAVGQRIADQLLGAPVLGPRLFAGLISRPSVRYFLRSMTYDRRGSVTSQLVDLLHRLGQRPGARWAPQAFIGGRLNANIAEAFGRLQQPVLIVWGKEATTTPLGDAPAFLERNPRATLKVFPDAALLPHDEQASTFNPFVRDWLKEHGA